MSYLYEWSFGMLKDAALGEEMMLKDVTAFNVPWIGARPTFSYIGSFTGYAAGEPWAGYRQFCETFLYPLLLQAYRNAPSLWLRGGSLEGIAADQCLSLLSGRHLLRRGVLTQIYLQAKAQARCEDAAGVGAVTHEKLASGTRTLYHCRPNT